VAWFSNGFYVDVIQNSIWQLSNYCCLYEIFHVIACTFFSLHVQQVGNKRTVGLAALTHRSRFNGNVKFHVSDKHGVASVFVYFSLSSAVREPAKVRIFRFVNQGLLKF